MDTFNKVLYARLDARVQSEGQAILFRIDLRDDAVDLVSLKGGDMQDRAEHLMFHLGNSRNAKNVRPDKAALSRRIEFGDQAAFFLHLRAIGLECPARLVVDDWTDIGRD